MISTTSQTFSVTEQDKQDCNFLNESMEGVFSIGGFFRIASRVALKHPSRIYFFLRTIRWQKKAAQIRLGWERQGIHVPLFMIFSITNRCNLQCRGCYHQALRQTSQVETSEDKLRNTIAEAKELGISLIVLAGGEPLVRPEILSITKDFPEIVFLLFTNGLLINDELTMKLKKQNNVVPVISLEGYEEDTDGRRGKGIYERLQRIIGKTKDNGIFWGTSLTVTNSNFTSVTDYQFIQNLIALGCKLFFFVEYTPIEDGTEDMVLTDERRISLLSLMNSFRSEFPGVFIAIPGDEEKFGGCLSAGRGFVHISAEGTLEPCPFAPYSDTNLRDLSLKQALQSEFLKTIRQNREQLSEWQGGCALRTRREWVQSLLHLK